MPLTKRPQSPPNVESFTLHDGDGTPLHFQKAFLQQRFNSHETPSDAPLLELLEWCAKEGWTTRKVLETALTLLYEHLSKDKGATKKFKTGVVTVQMQKLLEENLAIQKVIKDMLSNGALIVRDGQAQEELQSLGFSVLSGASNLGGAISVSKHSDEEESW